MMHTQMTHNAHPTTEQRALLRPYGKTELAMLYAGEHASARAALSWLLSEIEHYPGLAARLAELGYYPTQKMFTRAQVKAIFEAIGEP